MEEVLRHLFRSWLKNIERNLQFSEFGVKKSDIVSVHHLHLISRFLISSVEKYYCSLVQL